MAASAGGNPQSPASMEGGWQAVLDMVVPAVVALQVTAVRSFQDDHAGAHGGTGFVVDKEQGLILTNRHVCTCGPERTTATFVGSPAMEEVAVKIAYVDPVHDFAFLRFDPKELVQTPRAEIALDPAGCRVGEEIRVVGNDSLEKLQILSGTVARIDRNPPDLAGDYSDENTFYALAGSGTRGGSSGSPVLNRHGRAVALNAAATGGTMHAFYLPLHRVARALEAVRAGAPVTRGTICAALSYTSFPEVLRLGVPREFVSRHILTREPVAGGTFSKATPPSGMLQVRRCVPGTPAAAALRPGDVVLELNGEPCADFVFWDAALDESVGQEVRLRICRAGAELDVALNVQDQHDLIPHSFIELGLGVFHEVPYQTAQKHHIPLKGIYVAQAGFVFGEAVKTDAVILELNGSPCHDLKAFEEALQHIPNKEYFQVGWMVPKSAKERHLCESSAKMQRHWCTFRAWTLDRLTRTWTPRHLGGSGGGCCAPAATSCPPATAVPGAEREGPHSLAPQSGDAATAAAPAPPAAVGAKHALHREAGGQPPKKKVRKSQGCEATAALKASLCAVVFRTVQNFDMDLIVDSENTEGDVICSRGTGIVVDPVEGIILTDRNTVPQPLGDIEVTLGDVCRSASVWFTHPVHSFVVLRVDHNGAHEPFGEAAAFEDVPFEPGDETDFVGMDVRGRLVATQVTVQDVRLGNFPTHWPPRWQERNLEAVVLTDNPSTSNSGVLCDTRGRIHALYTVATLIEEESAHRMGYGIPVHVLLPLLRHLQNGQALSKPFTVPSLEVRLGSVELSKLRRLPGRLRPTAEWLERLASVGGVALQISGVTAGGPCDGHAQPGDLLVAVGGEVVGTAKAVEAKLEEAAQASSGQGPVDVQVTLLRRGKERHVTASVPRLQSDGTTRLLCWHGLVLRETPRAARELGAVPAGVYVSQTLLGSPGEANGIEGEFLLAVDGTPTPTLDALVALHRKMEVASHAANGEGGDKRRHIRVETADSHGRQFVKPLEPDPLFWPLFEMSQDSRGAWWCDERVGLPAAVAASP